MYLLDNKYVGRNVHIRFITISRQILQLADCRNVVSMHLYLLHTLCTLRTTRYITQKALQENVLQREYIVPTIRFVLQ